MIKGLVFFLFFFATLEIAWGADGPVGPDTAHRKPALEGEQGILGETKDCAFGKPGPNGTCPDKDAIVEANLLLLHDLHEKWDRVPPVFQRYLCVYIRKEAKTDKKCSSRWFDFDRSELLDIAGASEYNQRFALDTLRREWDRVRDIVNRKRLLKKQDEETICY